MPQQLTTMGPPPSRSDTRQSARARRAARALLAGAGHDWITEQARYKTRPSAAWQARCLIDALIRHAAMTRAELIQRTWETAPGSGQWRWAVGYRPPPVENGNGNGAGRRKKRAGPNPDATSERR